MKNIFNQSHGINLSFLFIAVAVTSCATSAPTGPSASAIISSTSVAANAGMNPQGSVRFVQQGNTVRVTGRISGLRPGQEHGFHVHEGADCTGDGLGTKGHFNPQGAAHGQHGSSMHHAGDLPSLKANSAGVAELDVVVSQLTVTPGALSVVGRGLIVHRDPDDFATQPTGNAGPRPGCAVIKAE